jgi:drug/metabolite transporter (DMT)-like permease
MKKDILSQIWMIFLFLLLVGFLFFGIFYVDNLQSKISILGIVAIIVAAFTSVLTVSINNKKAKEREYELHILKEKQKVFEHFYNSYFEMLFKIKKGQI